MDTVIFHMTTWSCCHILGFPRERLSLINIVPSKNERSHFVIHYENSLIENKQEFLIALFIFKMSFFRIECQEGEKLSFPSEIHLFSWPFPIISINSLLPLGIQQSISLACFQSEMRQWPWKKKQKPKKPTKNLTSYSAWKWNVDCLSDVEYGETKSQSFDTQSPGAHRNCI